MKQDIVFKLFYRVGDGKDDGVQTEKSCADEESTKGGWEEGRKTLLKEINLLKLVGAHACKPSPCKAKTGGLEFSSRLSCIMRPY